MVGWNVKAITFGKKVFRRLPYNMGNNIGGVVSVTVFANGDADRAAPLCWAAAAGLLQCNSTTDSMVGCQNVRIDGQSFRIEYTLHHSQAIKGAPNKTEINKKANTKKTYEKLKIVIKSLDISIVYQGFNKKKLTRKSEFFHFFRSLSKTNHQTPPFIRSTYGTMGVWLGVSPGKLF